MIQRNSQRIFLIITTAAMIISGNLILAHPQTDSSITLKLKIVPSNIESAPSTHKIGYVWFENKQGNPLSFPKDTAISLESTNTGLISVPSEITIPAASEFGVFEIQTRGTKGMASVIASYGDHDAIDTIIVGEQSVGVEDSLKLIINLPTIEMNVNSEMPFSLYLVNTDSQIMQAPFDIDVSIDYEENLIDVKTDNLLIEKGNSYIWGSIKTKDKVGNAFLRATVDKLGIDEAKEIKISSSLPSSLKVNIFPEKIPATLTRDIDVIVSLVDSDGLPTLAQEDVKLEFFSDDESINNQIDKRIKEQSLSSTIKKGEFSYRFSQKLDLFKENKTITIGAATKGLGVATDTFETVKPITTNNPIAENKTMRVYALDKIPTKSKTVAIYQIGTLVEHTDDDTEDAGTTGKKEFFPLIVNENYDSVGSNQKINIISSNNLLVKILETGQIGATSSYGAASIETGQETGQVLLSATIKGIGSSSAITEVINTLKQEGTIIFSPTGKDAILFDKNGKFDLFVIATDSKGRPTMVENEIRYLITPINEIINIQKGHTFTHLNFQGNSIQSEEDKTVNIKTVPIGESADPGLEASNAYVKDPTAKLIVFTPNSVMNSESDYVGIVQLVDFHGNPVILGNDLRVKLGSSKADMLDLPDSVTISAGHSYAEFVVSTLDKAGNVDIVASGKGIVSANTAVEIKPLATKLRISIGSVNEPVPIHQPAELKIYVDDELQNAVSGATVKVISSDSSVTPDTVTTQQDGSAIIKFNPKQTPKTSLQILAYAEGYGQEQKTFDFEVQPSVEEKKTEIPQWIIYGGVGIVAAISAGLIFVLRKPKKTLEDEEDIYE
ncbi:MAG TPA: hypothetical protein VNK44_01405 [Candidatus Nitrosotenuis sp.]|nr:hypothetical protein [Candidatus Nitrosotenuis sp.]